MEKVGKGRKRIYSKVGRSSATKDLLGTKLPVILRVVLHFLRMGETAE